MKEKKIKESRKNYWQGRNVSSNKLKRYIPFSLYKLNRFRFGDEEFIIKHIKNFKNNMRVLDIGCGVGQYILPKYGNIFGVDIKGFPRENVIKIGYRNALEYIEEDAKKKRRKY